MPVLSKFPIFIMAFLVLTGLMFASGCSTVDSAVEKSSYNDPPKTEPVKKKTEATKPAAVADEEPDCE